MQNVTKSTEVSLPEGWHVKEDSVVGVYMYDDNGEQLFPPHPIDSNAWRKLMLTKYGKAPKAH